MLLLCQQARKRRRVAKKLLFFCKVNKRSPFFKHSLVCLLFPPLFFLRMQRVLLFCFGGEGQMT